MSRFKLIILWFTILVLLLSMVVVVACGDDDDDDDGGDDDDDSGGDDDDDSEGDDDATECEGCYIAGSCYADSEVNPANACEICVVSLSSVAWSNNDFVPCQDGLFCNGADTCLGGTCSEHAGDPCPDDGEFCNGDESCDETNDECTHGGNPCDANEGCNDDLAECYDAETLVFVPEGSFWMGCELGDPDCNSWEYPRHQVTLSPYYIDIYEVTNAEYADFLNLYGNDCGPAECVDDGDTDIRVHEDGGVWTAEEEFTDHPMMEVSWYGAQVFCEYYGGRLPTEAEWEKAAKGADEHYLFPWGDTWIDNAANHAGNHDPWSNPYYVKTNPVGYYDGSDHDGEYQTTDGRSPYGAHDMAGNVFEWVNDWFAEDYYSTSPELNPQGPAAGTDRVRRGGSWYEYTTYMRTSLRIGSTPTNSYYDVGFRCVWE